MWTTIYLYYIHHTGELVPSFDKETLEYSIDVENNIDEIEVFVESSDKACTIDGAGIHSLNIGENKIYVTVETSDLIKRTYILTINRAKRTDNYLLSLVATTQSQTHTLEPEFNKETQEYIINVPSNIHFVNLSGRISEGATVTGLTEYVIYGKEETAIVSVTSEAGETREYKIKIVRELDSNNHLTNIIPSSGTFESEFMYEEQEYYLVLDEDVTELSFEVTTESIYAEVSGHEEKPLPNGESIRTITVTAENGETRDYIIHITREAINNSYLASLTVDGYELDKIFKKDEYHYVINVPYSKKSLLAGEVTAIAEDTKATVQKTSGLVLSSPGKNIFTILVTARDGFTTSQYVIEVIRDDKIQISGNVLTENKFGKHTADVIIYDKITKEEVKKSSTNEDGTFEIEISLGTYDIVIEKNGYLRYILTDAQFKDGMEENLDLGEFKIYAGDINGSGKVELNDLVLVNDKIILELNNEAETNEIYDFNGDGKIDILDREMLKSNYGKNDEKVKWNKP